MNSIQSIIQNNQNDSNNNSIFHEQIFAVIVDSIEFSYKKNIKILKNISLHVPKAQIYALLGPNGCGKTTLLNILLGRLKPTTGCVHILGRSLTSKRSTKLNHFMGFMPQEIALDTSLTIRETFHYFSLINHVKDKEFVSEKIKTYLQMLQLKNGNQLVEHLSGGQKRLLSLGVTLIYEPKILLLDEPTVGVDSIIRDKIWTHLRQICEHNKTSVIITTHYMEEASTSDTVGFIRSGEILAEQSPQHLMSILSCNSLEDVFYRICLKHDQSNYSNEYKRKYLKYEKINQNNDHNESCSNIYSYRINHMKIHDDLEDNMNSIENNHHIRLNNSPDIEIFSRLNCAKKRFFCSEHFIALLYREYLSLKTNKTLLFIVLVVPILIVTIFQATYGRTPHNIPCAIVNDDIGIIHNNRNIRISDGYFKYLSKICNYRRYDTLDDAIETVGLGKNAIAISIHKNFSRSFMIRYNQLNPSGRSMIDIDADADDEYELEDIIDESEIKTYSDHSLVVTSRFLNISMIQAFHDSVKELSKEFGVNPTTLDSPLEIKEFIYGNNDPNLQPTFLAGVLIITQIGLITMISSLKITHARLNGLLERDLNQSVSPFELNLSFHIFPILLTALQTLIVGYFTFFVLELPLLGSFFEVYLLLFFTNLQGIFIGSFISTLSKNSFASIIGSFLVMFVFFFTSGTLWPLEGMREPMQTIFSANPLALSTQALRSISSRKWSIFNNFSVLLPFITTSLTSLVLFILQFTIFSFTIQQK